MVVVAKVGFHLHQHPSPNPHTLLLLRTQNPLCHFHSCPIFISNHRFLLLLSSWPLRHIPRSRQYWDSNAESYNNNNNFNFDGGEDFDESTEQWDEVLEDYLDSIWIFKVFGSYGWMLPVILLSMLVATGPKAFLVALALPLGQSTFAFAIQRFQNRGKIKPKMKPKTKAKRNRRSRTYSSRNIKSEEAEAEAEWIRSQRSRKRKKGYQSWISKNDVSVSSSNRAESRGSFGGWDELDAGVESNAGSSRREARRSKGTPVGKGESNGPLLLRLLISIFPFLSSWTKVL